MNKKPPKTSRPTAQIIPFPGTTKAEIPPAKVLEGAAEKDLDEVIVLGTYADGEFYFAMSASYVPDILYLLQLGIQDLLDEQRRPDEPPGRRA